MPVNEDTTPAFTLTPPPISLEEERKAKQKAYYEANKERIKANTKAWQQANPDRVKALKKAWREDNRDKLKEYFRARDATPERKAYDKARDATPKRKAKAKAWFDANPDYMKAYDKARDATPKRKVREEGHWLKRKYRMTVQQRDEMIQAQGNRCLCCKTLFGLLKAHQPRVDHDHRTGKVRGILCNSCNVTLGHAADNPKILRALARYLERS